MLIWNISPAGEGGSLHPGMARAACSTHALLEGEGLEAQGTEVIPGDSTSLIPFIFP